MLKFIKYLFSVQQNINSLISKANFIKMRINIRRGANNL